MDEVRPVKGSASPSFPHWIRKTSRCEFEEFINSPPSNEGFFHLRVNPKSLVYHQSSSDHPGKELGFRVEYGDSGAVTLSAPITSSTLSTSKAGIEAVTGVGASNAWLNFTVSYVFQSVSGNIIAQDSAASGPNRERKGYLPSSCGAVDSGVASTPQQESASESEDNRTQGISHSLFSMPIDHSAEGGADSKQSLSDKLKQLRLQSFEAADTRSVSRKESTTSIDNAEVMASRGLPMPNYFFTGSFWGRSEEAKATPGLVHSEVGQTSLQFNSQELEKHLREGAQLAEQLDSMNRRQRRRPKASAMREMNFIAPQGM